MVKKLTSMTYEELQTERDANELLQNNLKVQIEQVTDKKVSLKLSQELLQISKRNEKLAARQVVLMSKVKRPMARSRPASYEMSLDEIEAETEQNKITIAKFEEDLKSSDFETRFNASQTLRTLYARHKALCRQRVALLSHSLELLRKELNATQKR
ncbi:hypothetical protein [Microcoleus sp. OTE_8_concoct_300]|uniref:hypothetical protein n=1 Tax=Microcoleus sp. OTE_8_concoct_300 TaxID=2964710 RepID=UPI00403F68FD